MPFSIIQCGSTARGDANANSDVDIICIWSGKSPDFTRLIQKHGELTFYSVETIRRMRAKGSLFITHLDVDGVFIDGDKSLLKELSGFRPSTNQAHGLYKNTARVVTGLEWFPDNASGELWLCDVLYVALRTCLYCKNAAAGIYNFGYLEALEACGLTYSQIEIMLRLREGKYRYRSFSENLGAAKIDFDSSDARLACFAVLSEAVEVVRGGETDWAKLSRRDYWGERLVERAILNNEHRDSEFMHKIKHHNYNKKSLKSDVARIIEKHISIG